MYAILFYTPADERLYEPEKWVLETIGPSNGQWMMDSEWLGLEGGDGSQRVEFRWAFVEKKHARLMEMWCELSDFEVRRLHPDTWND